MVVWGRVLEQAMHFGGYRRVRRFFRLMVGSFLVGVVV